MARQEVVTLVDDLDGSAADETMIFSIGNETYEIDLSKSNAKKFRDALSAYVSAARRVRGGRGRPPARQAARGRGRRSRSGAGSATPAQVRAWARSKGIKVNERGRIAADVVERYEAAH